MYQIVRREQFSDSTFLWEVYAPDVARTAQPGQFVMLRLASSGERIPLTVADFDRRRGTITMVIQAVGKTTHDMMLNYRKGDWFQDFVGPLGIPSHAKKLDRVVLVGGGLGVAPVFPQLRAYKEAGSLVTGIIGFRTKGFVFWEERFAPYCDELIVCTDDGSYGQPGFVTKALGQVIGREPRPSLVVAIGPLVMMRACAELTRPQAIPTVVSLNSIMVDGTGMCGSCRVTVGGKVRFACVDGPDFDGHQVDFPELMRRQERFAAHERRASGDFQHACELDKLLVQDGKRNYKKLKQLAPTQHHMPERPAAERRTNFEEVNLGFGWADALAEAERCIQCKKSTCIDGCPVAIDFPRFIRQILVRDLDGAMATIYEANLFPSICGRVCPQETQCEATCVIAKKMAPVAIGRLERFVGDHAPLPAAPAPARAAGAKKVAIVGSGPAGLSCAGDVARMGYEVTVFEALHVVGGVLRYGIPSFRLPRHIIKRETEGLERLGVRFEVNKVVGRTFSIKELMGPMGYAAVFVGTGAGNPVFLGIPGEQAGRIYSANEFLTRVNLMGGDRFPFEDTPVDIGDRIVVLGAGNTAMDCLRVSLRLGAKESHCVYRRTEAEAPARIEEIRHAKEEGVEFHFLRSPQEILLDEKGNVTGIRVQRMKLGEPDESGRRSPVPIEGEFEIFACDTVIYALGTRAPPIVPRATPELKLNKRNYIVADEVTQATNLPGVFAGGDIVTGGATVILALGAGRRAARGIRAWLETGQWPPKVEGALTGALPGTEHCPRCHRPVAEGEPYICCADRVLVWRCTSCQKVSEGFAFPYGLCAACGGRLVPGEATAVVDTAAEQAIRHAFEIELGSLALYARAGAGTDRPELKELFVKLAKMEESHLATLARRYHVTPPDPAAAAPSLAVIGVYGGLDPSAWSAEELLELAVGFEERARGFYSERARALEPGTPEWRLYRELEAEESDHAATLATELERYRAGKPGAL
ncbi:MAG: NADPH-dependent glutamate synthase [Deltaproteobacteria bacterium]|nr:NADPH-dependent glutamate synthase [Deltaproteobacteria bacterium]